MITRPSIPLLTGVLLAGLATGQSEEQSDIGPPSKQDRRAAAGEVVDRAKILKETRVPDGLYRFISPIVGFKPHRFGAGSSGECHIILSLVEPVVLEVGSRFQLTYAPDQGPVKLGKSTRLPAKAGTLPTKFKGSFVYDNTVRMVIPVAVSAEAARGQHKLDFVLEAEVTDGQTADKQGVYQMRFSGNLEVGDPVPRPTPREGPAIEASDLGATGTTGGAATAASDDPDRPSIRAADPIESQRGSEIPEEGSEGGPGLLVEADDSISWLLVGAPVGLFALVVLLLALKRRG